MSMTIYKKGQGTLARSAAAVIVALMLGWGCYSLFIGIYIEGLREPLLQIPGVGLSISWAFLIALAVFIGGGLGLFRLLNRPATADLLIDTETEMKKVSWPTRTEAWNSAVIVVVVTAAITAMLFLFDLVLNQAFKRIFGV